MAQTDWSTLVESICAERVLSVVLSWDMPPCFETANGTCVPVAKTLFLDPAVLQRATEYEAMFYLVHELRHAAAGFVVNAGAWTHTSIAIHDALAAVDGPVIEVHISDVHAREEFRHHSYITPVAAEVIVGHGVAGYEEGLAAVASRLREAPPR